MIYANGKIGINSADVFSVRTHQHIVDVVYFKLHDGSAFCNDIFAKLENFYGKMYYEASN